MNITASTSVGRLSKLRKTLNRQFRHPRSRILLLLCSAAFSLLIFALLTSLRPSKNYSPQFNLRDLATAHAGSTQRVTHSEQIWKGRSLSKKLQNELKWNYLAEEKSVSYAGSDYWLRQLPQDSRGYINSLAVFEHADNKHHQHGRIGVRSDGRPVWEPGEMPPADPDQVRHTT